MKFLTFDVAKVECELSPSNEVQIEAMQETNILTIGGPPYNNVTSYFQKEKTVLFFDNRGIVSRNDGTVVASLNDDYDYGILERIKDGNRVVIVAAGISIHGTRGAVKYLINNWKNLPEEFIYVITFPHPSKSLNSYKKPLQVKRFYS